MHSPPADLLPIFAVQSHRALLAAPSPTRVRQVLDDGRVDDEFVLGRLALVFGCLGFGDERL